MVIGKAFYNEWDGFAAQWLENLTIAGHLPAGTVSRQSINDIVPSDVADAHEVHLFAGIGGWPLALRMAGWPATRSVWTGSCPCQPFSSAGKRRGTADERHLWPEMLRLVAECRPATIFGEQVASRDGRDWLAGVRADLEALGYAVGAADLCAAGVGAPHIRQRLFWVADADLEIQGRREICGPGEGQSEGAGAARERSAGLRSTGRLGHSGSAGLAGRQGVPGNHGPEQQAAERAGNNAGWVADANGHERDAGSVATAPARYGHSFGSESWDGVRHYCLDGKWRRIPIEPELFPLADGLAGRVGQLRAYGNAIVPQVAAQFVRAFLDATA